MSSRIVALRLVALIAAALIVLRLMDLQVLRGGRFRELAEHNRLRAVPELAPRGLIVDRRGEILAANQTVFRVAIIPQEVDELQPVLAHVSHVVGVPVDELSRQLSLRRSLPFVPATIVPQIPKPLALRLEEDRLHLPGLLVRPETVRAYPQRRVAAHLLGYLGRPQPEDLPVLKEYGVRAEHLIGRTGLEQAFDAYLRGRAGGAMVEVDHRARRVRTIGQRPAEPGQTLTLTIDASLQALIEEAFGSQPGAAVVLDPRSGEVLALVSVPSFNPAAFIGGSSREVQGYLSDPRSPLLNRATVGTYTPGSIAKVITAIAALEHGVITPATTIVCRGSLRIGDRTFFCWNRDGHGPMTVVDAIRGSCNVFFMQVGRWLGVERLTDAMWTVGWGRRTGWLLEEHAGLLPGRRLTEGEAAMLAIGQGELLITPMQAALLASTVANGGWLVKPWVVSAIGDRRTAKISTQRLRWSPETFEIIQRGMRQAVVHPEGTAFRASASRVPVAGKTGTAQTHLVERPHGWFIGYCPADAPRVAMAIVWEHGGSGGDLPTEIARAICDYIGAVSEPDRLVPDTASRPTATAAPSPSG